jgi:diguanylate cyclase (GGDEF)-like protein
MRPRRPIAAWARLGLTRQVALLSLVPIVALGFVLARVLQAQIQSRALADATQSAHLIARVGIQPMLDPQELLHGLGPAKVAALDRQLRDAAVRRDLARIKIWNRSDVVIYSDDHSLIGRRLEPSDDLEQALAGKPGDATVVQPALGSETRDEVGLGTLVEVYVPLREKPTGPPAGVFEMYLSYRPIAQQLASDERTIVLVIAAGLALLWAILYRIVAGASRRLARQARENYRLARYDQLTGLPNRTLFAERLDALLAGSGRARDGTAVLLVDLERFKEINSTLGSANGDAVLREAAARLRQHFGEEAVVARVGADEYAVLCPHAGDPAGALAAAATIQELLLDPVTVAGVALNLEAAVGAALAESDGADAFALIARADAALARARSRGSSAELYTPDCDGFDAGRLKLMGEVRGALDRHEFVLHYQPKLDLTSRRITGVEALVRWQHPEHGLLAPGAFIPWVEQTALVGPVTLYVVEEALRQWSSWRRVGVDVGISVNLSARNLLDPGLPARIAELLAREQVPPARLTVEVTESAAMTDPARASATLTQLRDAGIGVSVDDFGTGNASIEYLAALPAGELKIDRSFVAPILERERDEAIVRATIDLARNLGLRVVAEGIESEEVLERVAALGCDEAQGYLIARPLPGPELIGMLASDFGVGAAQLADAPVRDLAAGA